MRGVAALVVAVALSLGGCTALILLPRAIDQMNEGPDGPTGFEFHRHDGATESGGRFRIRHFLDPDGRFRHVVALIDGKVFSARRDDITRDIEAARAAYPGAEGKSEADVTRLFGAPHTQSTFEDVRVFWYVRERDDVFVLIFRQGKVATSFRTNRWEMERILDKPSPWV